MNTTSNSKASGHPFFRRTFAEAVNAAINEAKKASDFVLSRAQVEAALQPIVDELIGAPRSLSEWWIRASHGGAGTPDAIVIKMYKEQRK